METLEFHSRGLKLSALANRAYLGNEVNNTVILGLHGWLDNAASFNCLMQQIDSIPFVSLDLPGHGFSSHRSEDGTYNITDDIIDIVNVINTLDCSKVVLAGHSRGAIIAALLSAALPAKINALVLIDGLVPEPIEPNEFPIQLGRHLKEYLSAKELSALDSYESAVTARAKKSGISAKEIEPIVKRGVKQLADNRWIWSADSRLIYSSAFKLSTEHINAVLTAIECPVLFIGFSGGYGNHPSLGQMLSQMSLCESHILDGKHHAHMQETIARQITQLIKTFVSNHVPS